MPTRTDGSDGRVGVGKFKMGRVAEGRRPRRTNGELHDPQVGDTGSACRGAWSPSPAPRSWSRAGRADGYAGEGRQGPVCARRLWLRPPPPGTVRRARGSRVAIARTSGRVCHRIAGQEANPGRPQCGSNRTPPQPTGAQSGWVGSSRRGGYGQRCGSSSSPPSIRRRALLGPQLPTGAAIVVALARCSGGSRC
jgi:hypothetical protein